MVGSAVAMAFKPINQSGKFSMGYFSIRKLYIISAHTSARGRTHTVDTYFIIRSQQKAVIAFRSFKHWPTQ
jgi:hypothetical protein